jgi:MFS family permease
VSAPATAARPGAVLALLCTVQFMLVLDNAIANVALPRIQADLGFSVGALQYVVSLYALTFGGFLILAGRAGDLFGRAGSSSPASRCSPWRPSCAGRPRARASCWPGARCRASAGRSPPRPRCR